jgi:probable phosphoglycerate mutase
MLDVYLTRHGQTLWNVEVKMQGRLNSPLTESGIKGAIALADKIREIPFSRCYSSPMPRALHTSHLLIGDRPVPLAIEQSLAEMDLGSWEGMTASTAKCKYPSVYYQFHSRPDLFTPVSGGESFAEVMTRAQSFLAALEALPDGHGPVLGVTHCILLQAIVLLCDKRELSTLRTGQAVDQTSLFHLQWDQNRWTVMIRNEPA